MTILTLSGLTKRYGAQTALDGVDLTLAAGERVALLGHNGAGKSTLMKLVLGLIPVDAGKVSVAGHAPGSSVARALTAYLPENAAFHPALTGREQIRHYLRLRGDDPAKADGLLERVGLGDAGRRRIGTYSKGMRQRIGLAQALIGAPRLMILDEPTSGLDPVSRREFYSLLDELSAAGTAILLSSHALSEVEARTDRIAILSDGRLVAEGSLPELRIRAALPLTVHLRPRDGQADQLASAFPEASMANGVLSFSCPATDKLAVMGRISGLAPQIDDFEVLPPSLDDIYSHISRRAA
ncbi:ABC transporter ATP-binding protein [Actibacterium sp. XHP0104]|uniref:ABC transporter ATP-binding protein n=1 Tax=Actibacterium sp. XHP0104 TaxID=2984335 RepID=UPI0021E973B9|nr:ABC transporter ATP-binding protein [Actibacterium sp. XHP0104]MCV2881261.1 ABC transporter ATP-binding protein [Actibacterium sp. XHP0104]